MNFFGFCSLFHQQLDPDPHSECGSGSRRQIERGSMRIRNTAYNCTVVDPKPQGTKSFSWSRSRKNFSAPQRWLPVLWIRISPDPKLLAY
jgi:hypothetical protein